MPLLVHVPVIKVKKRKRRALIDDHGVQSKSACLNSAFNKKMLKSDSDLLDSGKKKNIKKLQPLPSTKKDSNSGGGLDSLLSGYGSSSDED